MFITRVGNGWIDELGFYVPSTVFQSFRDDGRLCAMKRHLGSGRISPPDSNPRPRDPKLGALTAQPRGRFELGMVIFLVLIFERTK